MKTMMVMMVILIARLLVLSTDFSISVRSFSMIYLSYSLKHIYEIVKSSFPKSELSKFHKNEPKFHPFTV